MRTALADFSLDARVPRTGCSHFSGRPQRFVLLLPNARMFLESIPVILCQAIFNGDDRIFLNPMIKKLGHLVTGPISLGLISKNDKPPSSKSSSPLHRVQWPHLSEAYSLPAQWLSRLMTASHRQIGRKAFIPTPVHIFFLIKIPFKV
jgi:hypothetical protein